MKKLNKLFIVLLAVILLVGCGKKTEEVKEDVLPKPEISEGQRGELGIDKNVNESTIDKYLGREDAVYRDMRLLVDPASYEKIGGDAYLSGFVKGFEVIPYAYLTEFPQAYVDQKKSENVSGLYQGPTLFRLVDGSRF